MWKKQNAFHKPSKKDGIYLRRPKLIINNYKIQREKSVKFIRVLLDQELTWKKYIKLTENKIAKNIGILYEARSYLDQKYTMAFSSNTNLVFIVALKIAGFSINFSSIFKIISHKFGALIIFLCLVFASLMEGTI